MSSTKLKEIKLRQQNWLREREASIKPEVRAAAPAKTNKTSTPPSSPQTYTKKPNESNRNKAGSSTAVEKLNKDTRPKAKFHQWLASKNNEKLPDENFQTDDIPCKDDNGKFHDVPVRDNKINEAYNAQNYSENPTVSSIRKGKTLSADQFDNIADSIVRKVKKELNLPAESMNSDNVIDSTSSRRSPMNSHICPDCSKLMMAPDHSPMLVIPCGHSLCLSCTSQCDLCPVCDCEISNTTANLMLQQVIADFHNSSVSATKTATENHKKHSYNTSTDTDVDYREEYNSLCLRCDVLQSESEEIHHNMHKLNKEIQKNHDQVANIERQEHRLKEQIDEIQAQVNCLQAHKAEYRTQEDRVRCKIEKEKAKLDMVEETVRSLQTEAEKIRMLALQ